MEEPTSVECHLTLYHGINIMKILGGKITLIPLSESESSLKPTTNAAPKKLKGETRTRSQMTKERKRLFFNTSFQLQTMHA